MLHNRDITRRGLLKRAAGITAGLTTFPYFVASSCLDKAGNVAPGSRIVMGCIGAGGQGTHNTKAFLNNPAVRMVAVCDVNEDRRQKAKYLIDGHYGDKGWVHVNRQGIWAEPASLLNINIKPNETHLGDSTSHHADFIGSVQTRRDPISPVEAGHKASYLGLVPEIACRLGRKLKWDSAKEQFIGDREADQMLTRPMRSPWHL